MGRGAKKNTYTQAQLYSCPTQNSKLTNQKTKKQVMTDYTLTLVRNNLSQAVIPLIPANMFFFHF